MWAKGFGFTQEKNGVEYIRWDRVNQYLHEFGFSPLVGKDDFLRGGILRRNGIMRIVVTRGQRMDQEAVKDFLRDTREKRLAIAAARERMERTGQPGRSSQGRARGLREPPLSDYTCGDFLNVHRGGKL